MNFLFESAVYKRKHIEELCFVSDLIKILNKKTEYTTKIEFIGVNYLGSRISLDDEFDRFRISMEKGGNIIFKEFYCECSESRCSYLYHFTFYMDSFMPLLDNMSPLVTEEIFTVCNIINYDDIR